MQPRRGHQGVSITKIDVGYQPLCGTRYTLFGCPPIGRASAGLEMPAAHLHVVRRENPNGAWAKSRRQRVVPLDFLAVQLFDVYEFERFAVPRAAESDFLLVNLFREPIGAPMRADAINELIAVCSRRAGIEHVTPHRLRHAFGSNLADAGAGLDGAERAFECVGRFTGL